MSQSKLRRLGRARRIRLSAIYMQWRHDGYDRTINRRTAHNLTGLDRYSDGNPFEPVLLVDAALNYESALYRARKGDHIDNTQPCTS